MRALAKRAERRIYFLPTEELMPNAMQPRKAFDEGELLSLAESIKQHGILQPLTVREAEALPYPEYLRTPSFEIIAGERRWRAAQLAGLETVPCMIRKADRKESAELALVENVQRCDLDFFEEAEAIRNLLLMTSLSQAELASRLSISQSALSNKLRLLKLSASERRLITEHGLSERHARAFLRIKEDTLRRQAILQVIETNASASEAEALADRLNAGEQMKQDAKKPVRIAVIKDVKFFFNTFDKAVSLLEEAGFAVKQEREETENGYAIRLFVPSKRSE